MNAITIPVENPGARQQAIEYHYDTGNAFFALWLDPTMTYSGAQFEQGDSLHTAQLRKLDHHLTEAHAGTAKRLLDVGCGWGSTMLRAVENYRTGFVRGLTLSPSQAEYIRNHFIRDRALGHMDVRVESWTDHQPDMRYDALISIGAIEHFARPDLDRAAKIRAYREFFARCREWLEPKSWFSLQSVTWGRLDRRHASEFMIHEVFPETDPPELSELSDAMKGLFELQRIRCDGAGYATTLNHWYRNLRRRRVEAVKVIGEETTRRFERYLSLCAVAFHTHNLNLMRLTLRRID